MRTTTHDPYAQHAYPTTNKEAKGCRLQEKERCAQPPPPHPTPCARLAWPARVREHNQRPALHMARTHPPHPPPPFSPHRRAHTHKGSGQGGTTRTTRTSISSSTAYASEREKKTHMFTRVLSSCSNSKCHPRRGPSSERLALKPLKSRRHLASQAMALRVMGAIVVAATLVGWHPQPGAVPTQDGRGGTRTNRWTRREGAETEANTEGGGPGRRERERGGRCHTKTPRTRQGGRNRSQPTRQGRPRTIREKMTYTNVKMAGTPRRRRTTPSPP